MEERRRVIHRKRVPATSLYKFFSTSKCDRYTVSWGGGRDRYTVSYEGEGARPLYRV